MTTNCACLIITNFKSHYFEQSFHWFKKFRLLLCRQFYLRFDFKGLFIIYVIRVAQSAGFSTSSLQLSSLAITAYAYSIFSPSKSSLIWKILFSCLKMIMSDPGYMPASALNHGLPNEASCPPFL